MKVARLYRFRARHSLPGVAGYDQPHEHDYTVEVVVEGPAKNGMVVDTQQLDDVARVQFDLEGRDLNEIVQPSTVEELARHFYCRFSNHRATVTVWEDDDRWGQCP